VKLYTDGACKRSTNHGGWAFIAVEDEREIARVAGSEPHTTHQQMEIRAAIEAVVSLPPGATATVVSDSAYVVKCFQDRWFARWSATLAQLDQEAGSKR
jgi:ribonuclease HI